MNRQQISDLLDQDEFDRDAVSAMLEDTTGIDQPDDYGLDSSPQNDVLPSEFQIPGGFKPEMNQAMMDEFGFNAQEQQAQQQQAAQEQSALQADQLQQQKQAQEAEQQRLGERPLMTRLSDFPAAVNGELFTAVGIPGSVWESVGEMLDIEAMQNTGANSTDMRRYAAELGTTYKDEDVPNTAGTKIGTTLVQGLEFLLPVLKFGRAAGATASTVKMIPATTTLRAKLAQGVELAAPSIKFAGNASKGTVAKSTSSLPRRIAQDVAAPFSQNAGKAWLGEGVASAGSGYAAFELGQEYGATGEMYGGAIGGALPQLGLSGAKKGIEGLFRAKSSFANLGSEVTLQDYTKTIAGKKASDFARSISGKEDVAIDVSKNEIQTLSQAKLSGAKLTGDEHMLTLEQKAMASDPKLFNQIEKMQEETNQLAIQEMQKLGGNVRVEETQAFIEGNIRKMELLLDEEMKQAAINSKAAIEPLSTADEIGSVNRVVRKQVEAAKQTAKEIEAAKWDKVDEKITISTENTLTRYKKLLAEGEAFKSTDPEDIPKFVRSLLGHNKTVKKDGKTIKTFVSGKYKQIESLLDIKQFRTRVSSEIEATDSATQKRFLTRLRESITEDMDTAQGSGVDEAIAASRYIHKTFEGDIMNTIFKVDKFGNLPDESLTLGSVSTAGQRGLNAAVQMKKVLTASPEAYDQLESLVKIQLANSPVLKNTGGEIRINLNAAEKYLKNNKEVLDLFPKLKKDLNFAIGQEQRFIGTKGSVDSRIKAINESTEAKYREGKKKPGQVLPEILSSAYPEREMKAVLAKSNKTGRRGIKNAVIKKMMNDSNMDADELTKIWNDNKNVYSQAFNKYEIKRFERILKTMDLNKGSRKGADIGEILPVESLLISLTLKAAGLRIGHLTGQATGSPLAATAGVMKYSNKFSQWLDSGRAKELIFKAIEDPELFKALTIPKRNLTKKHIQKLMGYQLATVVNEFEEDQ